MRNLVPRKRPALKNLLHCFISHQFFLMPYIIADLLVCDNFWANSQRWYFTLVIESYDDWSLKHGLSILTLFQLDIQSRCIQVALSTVFACNCSYKYLENLCRKLHWWFGIVRILNKLQELYYKITLFIFSVRLLNIYVKLVILMN